MRCGPSSNGITINNKYAKIFTFFLETHNKELWIKYMPTENNCEVTYQFFLRSVHIHFYWLVFTPKNKAKLFTLGGVQKIISLIKNGQNRQLALVLTNYISFNH